MNRPRQIPGFVDYYITDRGNVWSVPRCGRRGRWLRQTRDKKGKYLNVTLCRMGTWNRRRIHRLVLETFVGPCPENMEGCHNNGDPTDNRLENLRWDTRSGNVRDTVAHGNHPRAGTGTFGDKNPNSKLSNSDRRMIIYQYATGLFSHRELGKLYGVSGPLISYLVHGKQWPFIDISKICEGRNARYHRKTG